MNENRPARTRIRTGRSHGSVRRGRLSTATPSGVSAPGQGLAAMIWKSTSVSSPSSARSIVTLAGSVV